MILMGLLLSWRVPPGSEKLQLSRGEWHHSSDVAEAFRGDLVEQVDLVRPLVESRIECCGKCAEFSEFESERGVVADFCRRAGRSPDLREAAAQGPDVVGGTGDLVEELRRVLFLCLLFIDRGVVQVVFGCERVLSFFLPPRDFSARGVADFSGDCPKVGAPVVEQHVFGDPGQGRIDPQRSLSRQ